MAKKIQKVETPIDQRETFVSIQKTFADSEISVEEKLRTLYELQQADIAIDKILQLRGDLPLEVQGLESDVANIEMQISNISEYISGLNQSISANKEDILDFDSKISDYQKQLENIANSREYDSINKEIENTKILKQIAEKNISEAKVAIAQKKAEVSDAKNYLADKKEELKRKKSELDNIVKTTSEDEKKLRKNRETLASKIDPRTMSAYDHIRESVKNHLAVVNVYNEDSCGGCFNTIIPQKLIEIASNKKLIICEHCGRIIVNADKK